MNHVTSFVGTVGADGEHWWFLFPFFWLLWLGVIATFLYFVVFRSGRCSGTGRARAILAERFARGEISGDELREKLRQLP